MPQAWDCLYMGLTGLIFGWPFELNIKTVDLCWLSYVHTRTSAWWWVHYDHVSPHFHWSLTRVSHKPSEANISIMLAFCSATYCTWTGLAWTKHDPSNPPKTPYSQCRKKRWWIQGQTDFGVTPACQCSSLDHVKPPKWQCLLSSCTIWLLDSLKQNTKDSISKQQKRLLLPSPEGLDEEPAIQPETFSSSPPTSNHEWCSAQPFLWRVFHIITGLLPMHGGES